MIRSSSLVRIEPKKRLMIALFEKGKVVKASSSKKVSYYKKEVWQIPVLPPFPRGPKEGRSSLSSGWKIVRLPDAEFLPSIVDQKDTRYCLYDRSKGQTPEQCISPGDFLMRSIRPG